MDSIRGLAAFIVVIHHCFISRPVYSNFFFSHWKTHATGVISAIFLYTPARIVWAGYQAVTLFYVLSGLVLALPWVEGRPPAYNQFALKRLCRLYIPYGVIIVAAGALNIALVHQAYVNGASNWVNQMTWTNPVTLKVIIDHFALIGHHATIDGATHTLIWEIRVSLLFPFLIWPIYRWGMRGALPVFACLLAVVVGMQLLFGNISAIGNLLEGFRHQGIPRALGIELQWTAYHACTFVFGILLATRIRDIRRLFARFGPSLSIPIFILGLLIFQGRWSQWHVVQEFMVTVGSILILGSSLAPGGIETMLLKPIPRYLGKISFSLYLVHVPVVLALTILTHGKLPLPLLIVLVVPISLLLAVVFDRLVTVPSATLGHRLTHTQHRAAVAPQQVFEEKTT